MSPSSNKLCRLYVHVCSSQQADRKKSDVSGCEGKQVENVASSTGGPGSYSLSVFYGSQTGTAKVSSAFVPSQPDTDVKYI